MPSKFILTVRLVQPSHLNLSPIFEERLFEERDDSARGGTAGDVLLIIRRYPTELLAAAGIDFWEMEYIGISS